MNSLAPLVARGVSELDLLLTWFQGTKLACSEGGCGACAVQVTSYNAATGRFCKFICLCQVQKCLCLCRRPPCIGTHVAHPVAAGATERRSINSCLCPVGSLDGCLVTTSEGIGSSKQGFSQIQGAHSLHRLCTHVVTKSSFTDSPIYLLI